MNAASCTGVPRANTYTVTYDPASGRFNFRRNTGSRPWRIMWGNTPNNIRNALDTWKIDTPMLRNAPMIPVWAWSNSNFGLARTDGLILGVDWSSFKFYGKAGRRRAMRKPYQDANKHNVRWQVMDDTCQIVCDDCRRNFALTSTVAVTETD